MTCLSNDLLLDFVPNRRQILFLLAARTLLASLVGLGCAVWAQTGPGTSDCNAPSGKPIAYVPLPGHPFGITVTGDGCHLFVAVSRESNGIAVLRREAGKIKVE